VYIGKLAVKYKVTIMDDMQVAYFLIGFYQDHFWSRIFVK